MKKVLLYGIGGVYNYGCEAIVRGTVNLLKTYFPSIEIFCASFRPDEDKKRLANCPVTVVPRRMLTRKSPKRVFRSLSQKFNFSFYPCIDDPSQADGMDAVFSIGGDIYTLNPAGRMDSLLFRFGDEIQRRSVPYIIWGASIGPFTANKKIENRLKKHFEKVTHIFAREDQTTNYLHYLGIKDNLTFFPDPAFFVTSTFDGLKKNDSSRLRIAVNLSPLSAVHCGMTLPKAVIGQAMALDNIINHFDADIILIPHVVDIFKENDDDLRYLKLIMEKVKCKERISLIDTDPGFLGIREVLVGCDLVIAARMHCAINAMTARIPTVLLAYSQKAKGMADFVYGDRTMVMSVADFEELSNGPALSRIIDCINPLRVTLDKRIQAIQSQQLSFDKIGVN